MASNDKGDALANIPAEIAIRFILPCVPLRGVAAWAATGHHWAATFFGDGTPLSPRSGGRGGDGADSEEETKPVENQTIKFLTPSARPKNL